MKSVNFIRAQFIVCALFSTAAAAQSQTDARVALVIGNAGYPLSPLRNPGNDAVAMSVALRGMGFTVIELRDGTKSQIESAVADAREMLQGRSGVGLLYFAGHAVQLDWRNYLLPVDADPATAAEVRANAVDVQEVINSFRRAGTRVNIIVLDACRDNPFKSSATGKGLAPLDAPPGTFLAYATAPGNVADDGDANTRNGLYTQFLLQELQRPEAGIEEIFRRVRYQVRQSSQGRQVPWESTSLEEEFVFATGRRAEVQSRRERESAFLRERDDWDRIKATERAEHLYAFLQKYPNGVFAEQAKFRLERIAAATLTELPSRNDVSALSIAGDRYRVGDELRYDVSDLYGRDIRPITYRVTSIQVDRIEVNGGSTTWDPMGNVIKDALGTRDPAKVAFPSNLALGKKWRTDYQIRFEGGSDSAFYNMRVAALEEVNVPAGRFRAYRVEGTGWSNGSRGQAQLSDTYWIDPATFIIVKSLWVRRVDGKITNSSSRELRRLHRAPRT